MMLFSCGFIFIFALLYAITLSNAEEIDLIADLSRLTNEKSIIKNDKKWSFGKSMWSLNCTGKSQELLLSKNATKKIMKLIINNENFGFCVMLKQHKLSSGTIFSIIHDNKERVLEIKVLPKRNVIRLIYFPDKSFHSQVMEKIEFAAQKLFSHSLCFEYISHNRIFSVRSDCINETHKKLRFRFLNDKFRSKKLLKFQIWIGQRNGQKSFYKGIMERMIFSSQSNFSSVYCSTLLRNPVIKPVAGYTDDIGLIINRLNILEREITEMKLKIIESEKRVKAKENCQCLPLCITSIGERKLFTETWRESLCRNCTCTHEGSKCDEEKCPDNQCNNKVSEPGKCCERCGYTCQYRGVVYSHMENFTIDCRKCQCNDGSLRCRRINSKTECPKLSCDRYYQVKIPGKCCKICKDSDFCNFSKCGANAYCVPSTKFICRCKNGYQGNPYKGCKDVNECINDAKCPDLNDCVNTEGSFLCTCKPGYIKVNSSELSCKATCTKNRCKNNSTCVAPDKCECGVGFEGPQCDIDIDECKQDLIKCPLNSECLNTHGGYLCRCINGYKSNKYEMMSVLYNHQCKDIDECSGERGIDYVCDIFSTCINTAGGYRCIFNMKSISTNKCQISKIGDETDVLENGQEVVSLINCKICQCNEGNIYCRSINCDCRFNVPRTCCPQCYRYDCNFTMIESIGASNNYGFQCMSNNSLCPNKECPKIYCQDFIEIPGQCCKFCRSDPITSCFLEYDHSKDSVVEDSHVLSTCSYNHKKYKSGEKFILHFNADNSCTKCLCLNQNLCCAKSFSCHI